MAVVNTKTTPITNMDATPPVKVNVQVMDGMLRESAGFITTNADDSIGSTLRFCRIPSRARVSQLLASHRVGSASAGIADIGLYRTAKDGGAVVDADFFASAWDFNAAGNVSNLDLTHEAASAGYLAQESEMQVWEALGLTSDPGVEYDVVATLTEAIATAACSLSLKVRYTLPE